MIHILEWMFRLLMYITIGITASMLLIVLALLFWDVEYIDIQCKLIDKILKLKP